MTRDAQKVWFSERFLASECCELCGHWQGVHRFPYFCQGCLYGLCLGPSHDGLIARPKWPGHSCGACTCGACISAHTITLPVPLGSSLKARGYPWLRHVSWRCMGRVVHCGTYQVPTCDRGP